jgi:hypothetical protein
MGSSPEFHRLIKSANSVQGAKGVGAAGKGAVSDFFPSSAAARTVLRSSLQPAHG